MSETLAYYQQLTRNWQELFTPDKDFSQVFIHLNSGFTFPLLRTQYDQIVEKHPKILKNKKNQDGNYKHFMNYYFGIENDKFVILMIDSISDREGNHENVFKVTFSDNLIEEYRRGIQLILEYSKEILDGNQKEISSEESTRISPSESLNRFLKWNLFGQDWVKDNFRKLLWLSKIDKTNTISCFPLIQLPFVGMNTLFQNNAELTLVHHFFGLKNTEPNANTLSIDKLEFDLIVTATSNEGVPSYFKNVSCICRLTEDDRPNFSLLPKA